MTNPLRVSNGDLRTNKDKCLLSSQAGDQRLPAVAKEKRRMDEGRLLKNIFEQAPEAALPIPNDRTLATLLQVSQDSYHDRSLVCGTRVLEFIAQPSGSCLDDDTKRLVV